MLENEIQIRPETLARMIDHTFLKPTSTPKDIESLCDEAVHFGFAIVAINPAEVSTCAKLLERSGVGIGAAIGFPLGQNTVQTKAFETRDAIANGATEIDTMINLRALKAGRSDIVFSEIENMVEICKPAGVASKVIIETCYLCEEEKIAVCNMALRAGVDFVKTSTGFGPAGATVQDVRLIRRVCGPAMGIKAAGGLRSLESALAMIRAGATRIGTSHGVRIMQQIDLLDLAVRS